MALLHEEDDHNLEDKRKKKVQRSDKLRNLKSTFHWWVCNFGTKFQIGDHVLHHLAFSLSNVIRQADENSS